MDTALPRRPGQRPITPPSTRHYRPEACVNSYHCRPNITDSHSSLFRQAYMPDNIRPLWETSQFSRERRRLGRFVNLTLSHTSHAPSQHTSQTSRLTVHTRRPAQANHLPAYWLTVNHQRSYSYRIVGTIQTHSIPRVVRESIMQGCSRGRLTNVSRPLQCTWISVWVITGN